VLIAGPDALAVTVVDPVLDVDDDIVLGSLAALMACSSGLLVSEVDFLRACLLNKANSLGLMKSVDVESIFNWPSIAGGITFAGIEIHCGGVVAALGELPEMTSTKLVVAVDVELALLLVGS
jgi:hypothetical protein